MRWITLRSLFCLALWFVVWMVPGETTAQLAPTGGHYAGRPSDTGYEPGMVNASGGYAASVPLDLPAARGGLPVPLQIAYGARGVGAAGLGWDVPLSHVRRDTSFAGRRPALGDNTAPKGREQVSLTLQGRQLDLVRKGQVWVSRHDGPEITLREQNGTWVLFDGQGRTYVFIEPPALAGAGLWLLDSVSGAGGTNVQLEYEITTPALSGGSGVSIDLVRVRYNPHPTQGCAKHEVSLTYHDPAVSPLALSMLGDRVLARMRILKWVDVFSHASCGAAAERLRRYELLYGPLDPDTQQPRLRSVQMYGRQSTTEQNIAVPVASYGYGSASTAGKLKYQKTQTIALPAAVDTAKISSTEVDGSVVTPDPFIGYVTWQSLTDVTGDGRPDLVFSLNGKLWVAQNRPGPGGSTTLGEGQAIGQLSDTTFANGPFETRTASEYRFTYAGDSPKVDHVWRQAIDVNGDGRVDIIDAAEEAGHWVVYLNTPGIGGSGVKWERRSYSIKELRRHLELRGLEIFGDFLPLSRRFTGRDRTVNTCWKFDGHHWVSFPGGWASHHCFGDPNKVSSRGPEKTFTEWEVRDINGDGYPDVVFNSSPVDYVVPVLPVSSEDHLDDVKSLDWPVKVQPRRGDRNNLDAVLNLKGVLFGSDRNPFSAPITLRSGTLCGVGQWVASDTDSKQTGICGFADVNGDGLLDRIEAHRAFLGTGSGFSKVYVTLPGPFAVQRSDQVRVCAKTPPPLGTTPFGAGQIVGMRDLTGDGIPDYVDGTDGTWHVSIGTGTGFADSIDIETLGSEFTLSQETESCDGKLSNTLGGLYDIDGDGKPEVVNIDGQSLGVYQLAGGTVPGTPEAGRLVSVENGYGAKTTIGYRSAKEDGITPHQVPFPEIVVTSVDTTGTLGLGGTLSATRYAYGGAVMMFDPVLNGFTLPGYQRSVELRVISAQPDKTEGWATITDTYGLAQFTQMIPKIERFSRYARAGRVRDVTVLTGNVETDPWAMLVVDVTTDARRSAATHYDWGTELFEEPEAPDQNNVDCFIDMVYPYDYDLSVINTSLPVAALTTFARRMALFSMLSSNPGAGEWRRPRQRTWRPARRCRISTNSAG
jgi:hypothetical protein